MHPILRYPLVCRVFKKSSSNGRVTLYLGRRDFVDHVTGSDPVDGVLLVERCSLNNFKIGSDRPDMTMIKFPV